MAIGFIWKKQIVMFVTMFVVVFIGLSIGALLHDKFAKSLVVTKEETSAASSARAQKNASQTTPADATLSPIQTPSLIFPTSKPSVMPPSER